METRVSRAQMKKTTPKGVAKWKRERKGGASKRGTSSSSSFPSFGGERDKGTFALFKVVTKRGRRFPAQDQQWFTTNWKGEGKMVEKGKILLVPFQCNFPSLLPTFEQYKVCLFPSSSLSLFCFLFLSLLIFCCLLSPNSLLLLLFIPLLLLLLLVLIDHLIVNYVWRHQVVVHH